MIPVELLPVVQKWCLKISRFQVNFVAPIEKETPGWQSKQNESESESEPTRCVMVTVTHGDRDSELTRMQKHAAQPSVL
jgi:hypothetical protein